MKRTRKSSSQFNNFMNSSQISFFDTKLEFFRPIGPQKAELLAKELGLFTYADLLEYYPFRYEDRSKFYQIAELTEEMQSAQIRGRLKSFERVGEGHKERLMATFTDGFGLVELVWFQGVQFVEKILRVNSEYIIFGKPTLFNGKWSFSHPEMEFPKPQNEEGYFQPVYSLTEKLKKRYVDSKQIGRWVKALLEASLPHIRETLPQTLVQKFRLISKAAALYHIHLPESPDASFQAQRRLKFEELFYNQIRLLKSNLIRKNEYPGQIFSESKLYETFRKLHLKFKLTNAQARVLDEIRHDMVSGKQMNRLLQGDVGSGKTIVAFLTMLTAVDNGAQACLMAPTEILADQHYHGLKEEAEKIGLNLVKLTGSTTKKQREVIHAGLLDGSIHFIVGTHALLEDIVQFKNLGLCVIDEQHRFGVAQRAKLWAKNLVFHPHVLVMTATPIPRTLAMTVYGDLDVSVIDELPAGRKPIKTAHRYDTDRLRVFGFLRDELNKGRQIYLVYPLIEENETLDLKDLMDGFESVKRAFPTHEVSIVHGKMKPKDKDFEMQRFIKHETHLMVATTVIEVGVNVPNASVMVIENAERFGLAQLHQLRGRVGRGAEQSFCILMTGYKLSHETRKRISTLCETNDGFRIAEVDLELRGAGDLAGTQQSGLVDLRIANLAKDGKILVAARDAAMEIMEYDPGFNHPDHLVIKQQIDNFRADQTNWARIS
jgi:ATP-dependent DNA helicase RecG